MSPRTVPTSIRIFGKEYVISCLEEEQAELHQSAAYLSEKMQEAHDSGKALGTERIAVMAALNIIHDHLQLVQETQSKTSLINASLRHIIDKIDTSLSRRT